jgi:hypothetical protein
MGKFTVVLMFFGPKGIDERSKEVMAESKQEAITKAKVLVQGELQSNHVVFFSSQALPL